MTIRRLAVITAALALALTSHGQNWSSAATWGGRLPKANDVVTIPKGKTVILDTQTPALGGLKIEGALIAGGDRDVAIISRYIMVLGGRLQIGTVSAPWLRNATITLTGTNTRPLKDWPDFGNKVLGVMGGTLELQGRPTSESWTKLAADVSAGAKSITLVGFMNWRPGDQIVIATSSLNQNHYDLATIAGINGATVTLTAPLRYGHLGSVRSAGGVPIDVRAEVGLLSRNIVIQGDTASTTSRFGGHAMFMNGMCPAMKRPGCLCPGTGNKATIQIANTEFRRMGQLNRTGRYPVHFHMMGATENCSFTDNTIRDSIQRGLVLHDVSQVRVENNVVFNTVGHNVVVETDVTTGNILNRNLALVNRQANPLQTEDAFLRQNDRMPSNFWMASGRNQVTGNAAAGSFANGFTFDGIPGDGPLNFRNNVAHAAMCLSGRGEGDFDIKAGILLFSGDVRPANDVIADNLVYHNEMGFWTEETGLFRVQRLLAVDNRLHTENRGVGNRVLYTDCLFANRITGNIEGNPVHFQYGSDVYLHSPTFVNCAGIAAFTDIAQAPQANLWVTAPRFFGRTPLPSAGDDQVSTYTDDALVPRGAYVIERRYATPAAVPTVIDTGDGPATFWRMPQRPSYSELDVRFRSALGTRIHMRTPILRSDGYAFSGGMFGYSVIMGAGLSYEVAPTTGPGYAVRMNDGNEWHPDGGIPPQAVTVVVPLPTAPSGVFRTGYGFNSPGSLVNKPRLTLALTKADFDANPMTTYWYDAAVRKVYVTARPEWIQIVP